MTTFKTGAIGDKRKLLKFFAAKEHHNLVLRIVDVLELRYDQVDWLIERAAAQFGEPVQLQAALLLGGANGPTDTDWRKRFLLKHYPNGHITLPFDALLEPLDMAQVKKLQEICFNYQGVRLSKGEPCRVEPCDKCQGIGRRHGKKCKQCDGGGKITIFLEMSDEERQLATAVA